MKREKGNLICLCTAVVYLIAAAVLILKLFTTAKYNFYLISGMVALGGLLSIAAFLTKSRSRFRPGWLLPQGITGIFVGAMMFTALFAGSYDFKLILLFSLPCVAIMTAILHISASFQIKCLGFIRWWILLLFGMSDLVFGACTYFYFLSGGFNVYTGFGIFFALLALQYIAEIITYKITVSCDNRDI